VVSRIDPATNKVTATIHVGPQPAGIAVSPGAVRVADAGGPSVSRIDPATDRVVKTIRVGPRLTWSRPCPPILICANRVELRRGPTLCARSLDSSLELGEPLPQFCPRTATVLSTSPSFQLVSLVARRFRASAVSRSRSTVSP
jgi:hypothetical protein